MYSLARVRHLRGLNIKLRSAEHFLRDIDCAFPSREEDDEEEEEPILDKEGKPLRQIPTPPRSNVTLSGLLNVLDSVSSEEGRLTFATVRPLLPLRATY